MTGEHPEVARLRNLATSHRTRCVELEQMFSTYIGGSIKRILAARSAKPQEYQVVEERMKTLKLRGELLEIFVKNDIDHNNGMSFEEFKNAMLLVGLMQDEQTIQRTFTKLDRNGDALISESEFLAGVIGRMHTEEFSFKSQIDMLNNEIKQMELKSAEDGDEIEKLLLENESLRDGGLGPEGEAELERLKNLVADMTSTHGELQGQLKQEMDREIHRLREFGTAMRNQLNLLQRQSVVGARTASRKILGMSGCTEEELDIYDRETERSQMIAQVRQIFINLDDQHMGDMDFEKYTQAYQWLAHNGATPPMHQLQKQFAAMDVSGSGLISEEQFLKSIISDMDVTQFTSKAQFDDLMEKLSDFDDHISDLVGGDVSQKLRDRLNQMKSDMDSKVGALFGKMAGMTGGNVLDFISPEVLDKHLTDAFNKYDYTGDGRLSFKEFSEAWRDLGLKASGEELRDAFNQVDMDKSGLVDVHEFKTAVKDNRLTELNMNVLLEAMGVQLGSVADRYAAFNSTQARRRKQRKTMEATLAERLGDVVTMLCSITGKPRDTAKAAAQAEMRETFDKFDRNGSGELNLVEYKKAWKFLGKPGTEEDMQAAFKGVDIDNSGYVEWDEFVFSLQGEEAQKYGLLADMEVTLSLLEEISTDLKVMRGERTEGQKELFSLKDRLSILQREVTNKTERMVQRMRGVTGDQASIKLDDLDAQLEDAFKKADSSKSGQLNLWQFSQAWSALGLGGNEEELKGLFSSSERLGGMSKGMDLRQFMRVVKTQRLAELSLRSRLATLEYLFSKIEGGSVATSTRRRMQRQKIDEEMFDLLGKMIDAVLPLTDDALSQGYIAKRDRYVKLREAFNKFDNPKSAALDEASYKEACRFAGFAGSDDDLMKQFHAVDVDGSGTLDFYEFVISEMGKKASKVGSLGYVKILNKLLGTAVERFKSSDKYSPSGGGAPTSPSNQRNAIRLNARKMVQRMTGFGGVDQKKLESLGIRVDRRAHSITAGMLEHILHD